MKKITLLAALFISAASIAQIASTSFEEPPLSTMNYTDTGDPNVAHDLVNNTDEPFVDFTSTGGEIGFDASYVPYDTPGEGLTDGDFVGVTDFRPFDGTDPVDYTDGTQGYQISDVDGNYILEFDQVDLTGTTAPTLAIDYFISITGYEGDGTENASGSDRLRIYVRDLTNSTEIDILDTTGTDINDLLIEGQWITGTASLLPDTTIQLVIEARTNASSEAFFFDNLDVADILGTDSVDADQFAIFPNPATQGFVNITSTLSGNKEVAVYDVLGKQVINQTLAGDRLDVANLNSGVYIVRITQGNATITKKLVIK
ncbi:MAG: T9SS type A sorting domain-containing protein [Flavobacteriales bacterium]|jgi:hypothetical protein|uniref:T9SS type A sorting domain-containing protein n=1 Tax=Candidatus Ulvibacter alkanivorans TaxID=2267620 RepID=UPI000DF12FB4|nr:T9SS type A sorting domain-containing protein [Candidatus Ulvibacter alkanivorans]MCH2490361.1 T9SS type A sorting domain-containing protein [Flavobacteriales bacterium]